MTEGALVSDMVRRQKKLTKLLKCLKCKGYTESEGKWNDGVGAAVVSQLVHKNQIVFWVRVPEKFNSPGPEG